MNGQTQKHTTAYTHTDARTHARTHTQIYVWKLKKTLQRTNAKEEEEDHNNEISTKWLQKTLQTQWYMYVHMDLYMCAKLCQCEEYQWNAKTTTTRTRCTVNIMMPVWQVDRYRYSDTEKTVPLNKRHWKTSVGYSEEHEEIAQLILKMIVGFHTNSILFQTDNKPLLIVTCYRISQLKPNR